MRSTSKSSGDRRTGVPRAAARQIALRDRLLDVEVERVAELVGLVLVGALVADAGALELVPAGAVLASACGTGRRAPSGRCARMPSRRELVAALALLDQPGVLEHLGQLGQPLERAGRVVAEQLAGLVDVDLGELRRAGWRSRSRFSSWSRSPSSSSSARHLAEAAAGRRR